MRVNVVAHRMTGGTTTARHGLGGISSYLVMTGMRVHGRNDVTSNGQSSPLRVSRRGMATATSASTPTPPQTWCMKNALFGLDDMRTGLLTHLSPRERVQTEMTLLPLNVRHQLMQDNRWYQQLHDACGAGSEDDAAERSAAAVGVPSETVSADISAVTPRTDRTTSGDLPPGVAEAPPSDNNINNNAQPAPPPASLSSSPFSLPWHTAVVGRPKVMRFLLVQYLQRPTLWWDRLGELLERVSRRVLADSGASACDAMVMPSVPPLMSALASHPNSVVFWSEAVVAALGELADMSVETCQGPRALWLAHVAHRRHDTDLLMTPQRPPFTFGELRPTVAPSDLQPRRFTLPSPLPPSPAPRTTATAETDEASRDAPLATDKSWDELTRVERDAIFSRALGTKVSTSADWAAPGVYFVNPLAASRAALTLGDDIDVTGYGSPTAHADDDDAGAVDVVSEADVARQRERAALEAAERRALRRYRVDDRYMRTIEPHLVPTASNHEQNGVTTAPSPSPPHTSDATTSSATATSTSCEQMNKLWASFQSTSSATLLDQYVAMQSSLARVQREVLMDVATQAAFLLLLFSRDEVRLVTAPEQTSLHLWRLHKQLQDAVHRLAVLDGQFTGLRPSHHASPQAPTFANLAVMDQVSFACFGCTHLPPLSAREATDDGLLGRTHSTSDVRYCPDAPALYTALRELYDRSSDPPLDKPTTATTNLSDRRTPTGPVPFLTDVQSFAVEMCFPRNEDEVCESLWHQDPPPEWLRRPACDEAVTTQVSPTGTASSSLAPSLAAVPPPTVEAERETREEEEEEHHEEDDEGGATVSSTDAEYSWPSPTLNAATISAADLIAQISTLTVLPDAFEHWDAQRDVLPVLRNTLAYLQREQAPVETTMMAATEVTVAGVTADSVPAGRASKHATPAQSNSKMTSVAATVKRGRGRPRKEISGAALVKAIVKMKPSGKRRGRPRKSSTGDAVVKVVVKAKPSGKKRGRPRKIHLGKSATVPTTLPLKIPAVKRKRGRPRLTRYS